MIYAVINFLVVCQGQVDMAKPEMMNDMPPTPKDDMDMPEKMEDDEESKPVDMEKLANTAAKMIKEDEMKESEEPVVPAAEVANIDDESIIDAQDLDTFEELDNATNETDTYNRFFKVEADFRVTSGPCYVHDATGEMSEKEYRDKYVKVIESRFAPGNCHHDCATPENEEEICYGFRDNSNGKCEIYLKPASTYRVSQIEENSEFAGIMCSIKGVNCGGHFAINCEHCSPKDSTEPETHCNGHCFYDYKVDYVAKEVTGTCVGKSDVPTVDCGAHLATSCEACPTRYTFVCPLKERYCHGECEEHGCGINCESEEPAVMIDETMPAVEESVEEDPMPAAEESMEKVVMGIEGDGFEGTAFDKGLESLLVR